MEDKGTQTSFIIAANLELIAIPSGWANGCQCGALFVSERENAMSDEPESVHTS
jgi:hypothetical protein